MRNYMLALRFLCNRKFFGQAIRHESEQLEALGYTFVESDLPPIVCEWCVGDSALCATLSEFDYSDNEAWKKLKPYPIERVLAGYWIFGGLVVIEDSR